MPKILWGSGRGHAKRDFTGQGNRGFSALNGPPQSFRPTPAFGGPFRFL